jgi:hypothetical protein
MRANGHHRFGSLARAKHCAILGATLCLAPANSSQAVDLNPKTFPLTILGVPIGIPVAISFDAQTVGNELVLEVQAQGNLKDLQDKAIDIARAIPMPRDNCARTGVNPVVDRIDSASITPSGNTAMITIMGQVTAWACAHPFGTTTKTIIAADSVSLSAPVRITVVDQKHVGLKFAGPVSVTTGHALTEEVANLLAGDVNASVSAQLSKALDASQALATLPTLPGLNVTVRDAEFAANGNDMLVKASGTARMGSETFNALLQLFSR